MKIKLKGQYANRTSPARETRRAGPSRASPEDEEVQRRGRQNGTHEDNGDEYSGEDNDDDADQDSGASSSSEASEEFLNAPMNDLPESSGDEYEDPIKQRGGRGRPTSSRTKTRERRSHFGGPDKRPVRSSRSSMSLAESNFINENATRPSNVASPRRAAVANAMGMAGSATNTQQPSSGAKRGRGRPPGSTNKRKGKARSESLQPEFIDDSIVDMDEEDDSGLLDDDDLEDDSPAPQSGQSTPGGSNRVVYGSDGKRRGGAVANHRTRAVKGERYHMGADELELPIDPAGEEKVDALGRLTGGREYKPITFTSPTRNQPDRLYILAIDAARCAGFRDSLYFFRRNPWIHKVNCSQDEKEMLIEQGRLHQNLRSRGVTIVTARSCFKVFGARFVKNGKYVTDDYYEAAALAQGRIPGTPAHVESYDPEIDNTTLAMPKIGNFAKSKAEGRPAYMRMEKAFEMLHSGLPPPEDDEEAELDSYQAQMDRERERRRQPKEGEIVTSDDEPSRAKRRKRKRPSAFSTLSIPSNYSAPNFGLITHPAYQSLVAGVQFGGNGIPPFGESWERSKARKPAAFLNGFNWMYQFSKFTSKETNRAIMGIRKEWNAYHRITLGVPGVSLNERDVEEEQEGIWEISDPENEDQYETLDELMYREGLDEAPVVGEDGEVDDRKRGRTPSPSLQVSGVSGAKSEDAGHMDVDEDSKSASKSRSGMNGQGKRQRRYRSPIRGFYDANTRTPQVRLDTQSNQVVSWEKLELLPRIESSEEGLTHLGKTQDALRKAAARSCIATVEYGVQRS